MTTGTQGSQIGGRTYMGVAPVTIENGSTVIDRDNLRFAPEFGGVRPGPAASFGRHGAINWRQTGDDLRARILSPRSGDLFEYALRPTGTGRFNADVWETPAARRGERPTRTHAYLGPQGRTVQIPYPFLSSDAAARSADAHYRSSTMRFGAAGWEGVDADTDDQTDEWEDRFEEMGGASFYARNPRGFRGVQADTDDQTDEWEDRQEELGATFGDHRSPKDIAADNKWAKALASLYGVTRNLKRAFKHACTDARVRTIGVPYVGPSKRRAIVAVTAADADAAVKLGLSSMKKALGFDVKGRAYATCCTVNGRNLWLVYGSPAKYTPPAKGKPGVRKAR